MWPCGGGRVLLRLLWGFRNPCQTQPHSLSLPFPIIRKSIYNLKPHPYSHCFKLKGHQCLSPFIKQIPAKITVLFVRVMTTSGLISLALECRACTDLPGSHSPSALGIRKGWCKVLLRGPGHERSPGCDRITGPCGGWTWTRNSNVSLNNSCTKHPCWLYLKARGNWSYCKESKN